MAQTYEPRTSVSEVARRNDLSSGLLSTWKRMAEGRARRSVAEPVALLPVHIADPPPAPRRRLPRAARMEIGLPGGIRLKVDAGVDAAASAAMVSALQGR